MLVLQELWSKSIYLGEYIQIAKVLSFIIDNLDTLLQQMQGETVLFHYDRLDSARPGNVGIEMATLWLKARGQKNTFK